MIRVANGNSPGMWANTKYIKSTKGKPTGGVYAPSILCCFKKFIPFLKSLWSCLKTQVQHYVNAKMWNVSKMHYSDFDNLQVLNQQTVVIVMVWTRTSLLPSFWLCTNCQGGQSWAGDGISLWSRGQPWAVNHWSSGQPSPPRCW